MRHISCRIVGLLILVAATVLASSAATEQAKADARLSDSFRRPAQNGWTFVHLQGSPAEIGFQHGYLLAAEIEDALKVTIFEQTRDTKKDWKFLREAAQQMMWPHIEQEYREELQGIADGATRTA